MGLDFVELALRVEDEFDVSISDADLEQASTPEKFANIIYWQYQTIQKEGHSIESSFYQVRNIFIEKFGFKKEQLHPNTSIKELFQNNMIKNWKRLNSYLPLNTYHSLKYSRKTLIVIWTSSLLVCILLTYIFHLRFNGFFFSLLGIFMFIYLMLKPYFAKTLPKEVQTLADLIRYMGSSKKIDKYKSKEDILDKVIKISIEELGLSPEQINPNSHYVNDLGAG